MTKPNSIVTELRSRILPTFLRLRRPSNTPQLSEDDSKTSAAATSSSTTTTRLSQAYSQAPTHQSRNKISLSLRNHESQDFKEFLVEEEGVAIPKVTDDQLSVGSPADYTTPIGSGEVEKPVLTLERPTPEDDQITTSRALAKHSPPVEQQQHHYPKSSTRNPLVEKPLTSIATTESVDYFGDITIMPEQTILHKRVWVKRLGASATLVQISEEDLVDDVREKILRKYANSLGRTFDSPDVTIRIIPRIESHGQYERPLGPEESVATALNQYYPSGQTIDEALIIDIPHRRTPRHSPRVYMDQHRPSENGGDYFSVMPVTLNHSPHLHTIPQQPMHTISVLNTGQLPTVPLPSPGAVSRRHASYRPKYGRTATISPTAMTSSIIHPNPLQGML